MSKNQREMPWEPWDGKYIGNIWGKKFTRISIGIVAFFGILIAIRYATIDPETYQKNQEQMQIERDSFMKLNN